MSFHFTMIIFSDRKISQVPVYSSASGYLNPFTWGGLKDLTVESWRKMPTQEMMWYPSALYCASSWGFKICILLFHIVPAFLLDIYQLLTGQRIKWVTMNITCNKNEQFTKKSTLKTQVKRYNKVHSIMESYRFFTTHSWKFISKNQQLLLELLSENDRNIFYFDILQIDWRVYITNYVAGIKKYILKDGSNNIPKAKANLKR